MLQLRKQQNKRNSTKHISIAKTTKPPKLARKIISANPLQLLDVVVLLHSMSQKTTHSIIT
jgi:hypothetical protein